MQGWSAAASARAPTSASEPAPPITAHRGEHRLVPMRIGRRGTGFPARHLRRHISRAIGRTAPMERATPRGASIRPSDAPFDRISWPRQMLRRHPIGAPPPAHATRTCGDRCQGSATQVSTYWSAARDRRGSTRPTSATQIATPARTLHFDRPIQRNEK